jgi:pyrroline-5-carboxylate reductase
VVTTRIGFLGAGKMATALAKGWLVAGIATPQGLLASDPLPAAREAWQRALGVPTAPDNRRLVEAVDVVVVAVKPQNLAEVLAEVKPVVSGRHLVISIVAGATLEQIARGLEASIRVVRVMPNTPCLVGACAAAFSPGQAATEADVELVAKMMQAVGVAHRVPEKLLDAVTGLSSSGPAFVAVVIEALSDGGVRMGLPRDVATALAAQTVLGTAKMVLDGGLHPGVLKDMVASAGGTTIAGLHALERRGLRAALMDAVEAATRRSEELGKNEAIAK